MVTSNQKEPESTTKLSCTRNKVCRHITVRNICSRVTRGHKRSILINMMHLTLSDRREKIKDVRIARRAPLFWHPQDKKIQDEVKFFQSSCNDNRPTNEVKSVFRKVMYIAGTCAELYLYALSLIFEVDALRNELFVQSEGNLVG